ncbi:MAG TPA: DUF4082 domain-containing protein, partial [Acidimicrobiales bacterium]
PNPPGVCPCSLWNDTATPAVVSENDASAVELGVRFTADSDGTITALRFYKGPQNTGVHTGTLWSGAGAPLATATFTRESTTGWQQVQFSAPVPVVAGQTYVASYHTTTGFYSTTAHQFSSAGVDNAPLHAPANDVSAPNGVFGYGASAFPTSNAGGSNYWVDVVFNPDPDVTPPSVVSQQPGPGATGVAVGSTVVATMSEPLQPGTATLNVSGPGGSVAGSVAYSALTKQVTFTPSAPLDAATTYTATLSGALDVAGNALAGPVTWSFTTSGLAACPCGLFSSSAAPVVADSGDGTAVEVGMRFTSDTDGWITGARFYKSAANTGVHTGSLWTSDGTLLASATFSGESGTGWQSVSFASAVPVTAGTTYIVSYNAPNGHYANDEHGFDSAIDNAPLHGLANPSGGNGVYRPGTGFPTSTFHATNYWVDAVLSTVARPDVTAPTVVGQQPGSGATGVAVGSPVVATMSEALQPGSASLDVSGPGGSVAGSVSYSAVTDKVTFTPSAPLAAATTYTATLSGALDVAGNPLAGPVTWSFTTSGVAACPCGLFSSSSVPVVADSGDATPVEVGMRFTSDTDGWITGARFYKAAGNTGSHIASLWASDDTLLATAPFSGESGTGWQSVSFTSAVPVTAGTTYVVSYTAPNGHYANDGHGFDTAIDNAPLHGLADSSGGNGVYTLGTGFPTKTFNATNYWVDATFTAAAPLGAGVRRPTPTASVPARPAIVGVKPTSAAITRQAQGEHKS